MTQLLVSVRDMEEAAIALGAGVHWIDIKEPRRGSLGPADVATIESICCLVAGRVPVSAALGELIDQSGLEALSRARCVRYAKLGLAGCAEVPDWERSWAGVLASFPATTTGVAVGYADWRRACAPHPLQVFGSGLKLGCGAMLVDTFDKSRGGLLEHMEAGELAELIGACRDGGMMIVLAGSLTCQSIPRVLPLGADYIAVRGAACRAGRQGRIDAGCLGDLLRLLSPQCEPRIA